MFWFLVFTLMQRNSPRAISPLPSRPALWRLRADSASSMSLSNTKAEIRSGDV